MSFSSKVDISYNTPSLSDLFENDKPWNKHRSNADKVATYYAGSEFQNYSDHMDDCSELLDFQLISDTTDGLSKLKLNAARFCKDFYSF